MGKIFFWLGIFVAIFVALKFVSVMQRKKTVKGQAAPPEQPKSPDSPDSPQSSSSKSNSTSSPPQLPALLACARCGVHFPSSDAVEKEGRLFCSADHAR
jgi:uncharacterized protein